MRALPLFALVFALGCALGCADDFGGPLPGPDGPAVEPACLGGLCLGGATVAEMAARADALETCVPERDDFADPQSPDGLAVGGIELIEDPEGPMLQLALINTSPWGFYGYPGLRVQVLQGATQLRGEWSPRATRDHVEQFYGIEGCGRYVFRLRLEPGFGMPGPITLRAAATVLHAEPADEWVFVLEPR